MEATTEKSNLVKFEYPEHIMEMVRKEFPEKMYADVYVPEEKISDINTLMMSTAQYFKRNKTKESEFFPTYWDYIHNLIDDLLDGNSGGGLVYNELANFATSFAKLYVRGKIVTFI